MELRGRRRAKKPQSGFFSRHYYTGSPASAQGGEGIPARDKTKSTAGKPVVLYVSVQISPERWRRWGRCPRRNRSPGKHRHR